jgi:hypothetical protein
MRESLDSQLESTRLGVDSKMTSVFLELDRVHKLLQIRPTNSDFQQVCVCVCLYLYALLVMYASSNLIFDLFFVRFYLQWEVIYDCLNLRMNLVVIHSGRIILEATFAV